jgi:hypothetical protein
MNNSQPRRYAGINMILTDNARIALAAYALTAAGKRCNEARKRALCEQAVRYLLPIVEDSGLQPRLANAIARQHHI